jgi:hypothetical protein
MIALVCAALAVNPAISQVTVYGDRARVVRTAEIAVSGAVQVELPLLPAGVDPDSIRLEASGAQVLQVEIERVDRGEYPSDAARALLEQLEKLDDEASFVRDQQTELGNQLAVLASLDPKGDDEPLRPRTKLNAKRWDEVLAFPQVQAQRLQESVRELDDRAEELVRQRAALAEKSGKLGIRPRIGFHVAAALEGHGTAKLKVSYLVSGASWTPGYDLQLEPDQKSVRVSFSGSASQATGEDWDGVRLILSTAQPATVRALPEIATWKIGEKERFIPTPIAPERRRSEAPLKPPAEVRPADLPADDEWLRWELSSRLSVRHSLTDLEDEQTDQGPRHDLTTPAPVTVINRDEAPASSPPPPIPDPDKTAGEDIAVTGSRVRKKDISGKDITAGIPSMGDFLQQTPATQIGIAPPPSWRPPAPVEDSPAELAGGFDLQFESAHRESLRDGEDDRRVLLFTEAWPVITERLIEPALSPDAYLVARLKNPSERTLPRAEASLSVGADPAGTATLPLVAPGQELTLPLGIDRGIRTFRNVALVQSEKGIFSKDDVTRYAVTIEVQNPHPAAVPLRIVDQLPLPGNKDVEIELVEARGAQREADTGKLTFVATAPPAGSVKVGFVYQLKRPKGYEVHQ